MLFEKRSDKSVFKLLRERTFSKRQIDDGGNGLQEGG